MSTLVFHSFALREFTNTRVWSIYSNKNEHNVVFHRDVELIFRDEIMVFIRFQRFSNQAFLAPASDPPGHKLPNRPQFLANIFQRQRPQTPLPNLIIFDKKQHRRLFLNFGD